MSPPYHVYLLHCADDTYYVGHTDALEERVAQHQAGEFVGTTRDRRPVSLVWSQEAASHDDALAAALRIKAWGRARKEALIRGEWETVQRLARNRQSLRAAVQVHPDRSSESKGAAPSDPQVPIRLPDVLDGDSGPKDPLFGPVLQGERRAIAKTITLLESTRPEHRARADALLNALLPHTGRALRLGISGVPGVGKSTFIEALGLDLIERGHKVAVLAIDPSSSVNGGSILGDKTRMERLSVREEAYIRPSPASGTLGGVAEKTREALLVCEAAGYDVVIIETVGVGQSETAVARMTDLFTLLQLPNAGDDLQAIKRGVMELADLVLINKADLDPQAAAQAQAQIVGALRLTHAHDDTQVLCLSALRSDGLAAFWEAVQSGVQQRRDSGRFAARRQEQALAWMWDLVHARLLSDFRAHPAVRVALSATEEAVRQARIDPSAAARALLYLFERPSR